MLNNSFICFSLLRPNCVFDLSEIKLKYNPQLKISKKGGNYKL